MLNTSAKNANRNYNHLADIAITALAGGGVLFVTAAGLWLSYDALRDLASRAAVINAGLTWLWPLTLDALAIVASLNVLWAESRQERDNYAWVLVIAFTGLSVIFNATHASLNELLTALPMADALVGAFVGIIPPIAAAFALHLLVRLLRRVLERVSVLSSIEELNALRSEAAKSLKGVQAEAGKVMQQAKAEADKVTRQAKTEVGQAQAQLERLRAEIQQLQAERDNLQNAIRAKAIIAPTPTRVKVNGNGHNGSGVVAQAAKIVDDKTAQAALDSRQEQVLTLLRAGRTQKQIAAELEVSRTTVQRDVAALREAKLWD